MDKSSNRKLTENFRTNKLTDKKMDRRSNKQTDRQKTGRRSNKKTDRQKEGQTDFANFNIDETVVVKSFDEHSPEHQ